jgi:hypothetical protein
LVSRIKVRHAIDDVAHTWIEIANSN